MLNSLKQKAQQAALSKFQEVLGPEMASKLDSFKSLKPADVSDDEKYHQMIITPLWTVVKLQSGGALSALQKFVDVEGKFKNGMLNVRNELIHVEGDSVKLDPEFNSKLVPTLMQAFK